jgi:uncharacterized membrane protein YphA (DoxX/SURF4 family)
MTLVRRIARPMLGAMFVVGGLDALRHPATKVDQVAPFLEKVGDPLGLPDDPELLVRANGATMLTGGVLLSIGRFPRFAATALAAALVPTTYAGHPFWEEKDPVKRKQQRTHFLKNLGLLGGVLLAAVDTEGKPGLSWRAKNAVGDTRRGARRAAKAARREAKLAAAQAENTLT